MSHVLMKAPKPDVTYSAIDGTPYAVGGDGLIHVLERHVAGMLAHKFKVVKDKHPAAVEDDEDDKPAAKAKPRTPAKPAAKAKAKDDEDEDTSDAKDKAKGADTKAKDTHAGTDTADMATPDRSGEPSFGTDSHAPKGTGADVEKTEPAQSWDHFSAADNAGE